jgi:putative ABC transport system permease protein
VTAALVGLKSRAAVFNVQRFVADYEAEPLLAVLPGVALDELWQVVGLGERALLAMSAWWRWSAWPRWWRWCWPA